MMSLGRVQKVRVLENRREFFKHNHGRKVGVVGSCSRKPQTMF
jgi:hypothetical protein